MPAREAWKYETMCGRKPHNLLKGGTKKKARGLENLNKVDRHWTTHWD